MLMTEEIRRRNMDNIMRVQDLIRILEAQNPSAPVMIAVVKYPSEFMLEWDDKDNDEAKWKDWRESLAVEVVPLENGEITTVDDEVTICVELTDFKEELTNIHRKSQYGR
jgi:hypothetical protein